jgi:pSer/pThr/pTyr-binding forkhead associated (FHA) protein
VESVSESIRTIVIRDQSGIERAISFDQPVLTIGREPASSIRIDSLYVSRRHARLERQNGDVVLVDLGSSNGTEVNGSRVQGSARLAPGDVVTVGDVTLECLAEDMADGRTRTLSARKPHAPPPPPDLLRVDTQAYEVFIGSDKLERRLSSQEFQLLAYLYTNRERVCQRQELGDTIWGQGNWDPNMLHRLVHRLKEKLEPNPDKPRYIQTVPWVGYRLTE